MKIQRYRLTGVRYENGDVQLIDRPQVTIETDTTPDNEALVPVDVETKQPAA